MLVNIAAGKWNFTGKINFLLLIVLLFILKREDM